MAAHCSGLFIRLFWVGNECDRGLKGLRMRERGCERGESDDFTLFLIKDQDVGISGEGVEVKSEKTEFRVIPGQKSGSGGNDGAHSSPEESGIADSRNVLSVRIRKEGWYTVFSAGEPNLKMTKSDQMNFNVTASEH